MSGGDGFVDELRGLASVAPRDPGYTAPSTADVNPDEPLHDTSRNQISTGTEAGRQRTALRLNAPGPARRDEPNDYGWRLQHRQEIRGAVESVAVVALGAAGVYTCKPEVATRFTIIATGNCTVLLSKLAEPVSENSADPAAPLRRCSTSFVVVVQRHGGAVVSFPEAKFSQEYYDSDWVPDGVDPSDVTSPYDEPLNPTIDRYVFEWTPGLGTGVNPGQWLGMRTHRNFQ